MYNKVIVLIPLNRVIVIESTDKKNKKKRERSLNPLKSGHCYWITYELEGKTTIMAVLIPLNRVIVIE